MSRLKPIASTALPPGPREYRFGTHVVEALQVHHHPDFRPIEVGVWCDEADKIAWIDRATGLPCITLREDAGNLRGFVAIWPGHPLFGYNHRAIPHSLGITVHGGLDYGEPCDHRVVEARGVCQVVEQRTGNGREAWWFGFSCDEPGDLVPGRRQAPSEATLEYRDERYVHAQVVSLAAQLAAIDVGLPSVAPPCRRR